ncbi:MAG TPA: rhodanese-related sulfurtransferase [Candidatus Eisenbacteria bacterium]|nr:rhodanese-related sulfurtransferase [Candidatus Eisenbacteria bacterium]
MSHKDYHILLYYKYVDLENPEQIRDEQRALCESLGLTGRILLANEGINGTVEGTIDATEKYIASMEKSTHFKGIVYKKSVGTGNAFPKLIVRVRPEIVTAGIPNLNPLKVTGKYITAEILHKWLTEKKKELYIVDMRNDYEYASGHFENSLFSGIHNFYNLKDVLPKLSHIKDATIVTVCTGGIRCEKASGFLVANGFKDVYQLQDGIVSYMEKYPNEHFKGKLYVFDGRLTMGFNTDSPQHEIVGKCMLCNTTSELYVNCEYDVCHYHFIACENCRDKETGVFFDKAECKEIYLSKKLTTSNSHN